MKMAFFLNLIKPNSIINLLLNYRIINRTKISRNDDIPFLSFNKEIYINRVKNQYIYIIKGIFK